MVLACSGGVAAYDEGGALEVLEACIRGVVDETHRDGALLLVDSALALAPIKILLISIII